MCHEKMVKIRTTHEWIDIVYDLSFSLKVEKEKFYQMDWVYKTN